MTIRMATLAVTLVGLASPALSLSCIRPDVARSFSYAAEAKESYIVVHGKLRFNEKNLPESVGNESPPTTRIKAQMTGTYLSKDGFKERFDRNITLEVACFGPWCGGASSGQSYLAFLRKDSSGYTFVADPCNSMEFSDPTSKQLHKAEQCMKGGPCKAASR